MINFRLAFRTLFKTPSLTIIAILSLALGIGANAAIFSLFNMMLLRPLPVQEPSRLVNLSSPGPKPGSQSCNNAGDCDEVFSYPMFRDLQAATTGFAGVAAHRLFGANLSAQGQTQSGEGLLVSGSYFSVLGLQPALGRLLGADDDRTIGESHVAVLSHAYWQTRFGSRADVLNQPIIVNGQTMTIVGVAPRGFDGTTLGSRPQVFVPITMRGFMNPGFKGFDNRQSYWAYLFARLKPGVTIEQARNSATVVYRGIVNAVEAPLQKGMSDRTMALFKSKALGVAEGSRGQSSVRGEALRPLALLLGVTGLVLLIACANIANLLLARAASRAGEMAIRLSIGASRWQLVAQLLTESVVLAMLGGGAGLIVARWTLDLMLSLLPSDAAQSIPVQIDVAVMLFAAALALGTGLLFGLFPALHSTRPDLLSTLKGQSGQPSGARAAARFRRRCWSRPASSHAASSTSAG
jgi:predicted permease